MDIRQDVEQAQKICLGCKAGISWYQLMNNKLHHVDILATYDYGYIFPCMAESLVEKYIIKYLPSKDVKLLDEFKILLRPVYSDSEDELSE